MVTTAVNTPTQASTSGFQWPINARVTSEYGYRIHPVYGTRRLHAGMDIGAAGGTPIASSNNGVVIFAGRQGGYGNTVIVDHGGGITTLYAHQSRIGVSVGQAVDRGDIVGFVGGHRNRHRQPSPFRGPGQRFPHQPPELPALDGFGSGAARAAVAGQVASTVT